MGMFFTGRPVKVLWKVVVDLCLGQLEVDPQILAASTVDEAILSMDIMNIYRFTDNFKDNILRVGQNMTILYTAGRTEIGEFDYATDDGKKEVVRCREENFSDRSGDTKIMEK